MIKIINITSGLLFLFLWFVTTPGVGWPATHYQIGAYYFPGWAKNSPLWQDLTGTPDSRSPGQPWPEREPLMGFGYDGDTVAVAQKHIDWAADYGIDFFVYDWYWTEGNQTIMEGALQAYLRAPNRQRLKFCLLWANHRKPPSRDNFLKAVDYWLANYFTNPQYFKIDGRPVVFIFSPENLEQGAIASGTIVKGYLDEAQKMARKKGFKGIYFVGCARALDALVTKHLPKHGYAAISGYNYHRGYSGKEEKDGQATSYEELLAGYQENWRWILKNSPLPYFVPMIAGWDKRPAGERFAGPHNNCVSTPASFETMLRAGKEMLDRYPEKTKRIGIICAWNEFIEGSYIEPTKKWGTQYLEKVKQVFSK